MIKLLFFVLFFSLSLGAAVRVEMNFMSSLPEQGNIEKVVLKLNSESVTKLAIQKLRGQIFREVIYFQSISPLVRKGSGDLFESEAHVIFAKIPEQNSVTAVINGEEVTIEWENIQFKPNQASESFILGAFEVPGKFRIFLWALGLVLLLIIGFMAWAFRKKTLLENSQKLRRKALKDEVLSATDFYGVVNIWKNKLKYVEEFPKIKDSFQELEKELFKVQFKPHQSEAEKLAVMNAYRYFCKEIEGGLDGI